MKIKNRLYGSMGISFLLMVILLTVILITSGIASTAEKKHILLNNIFQSISELNVITYDYLLHRENRMEMQWNIKYNSLGNTLADLSELEGVESIQQEYSRLGHLYSTITSNYDEIIKNTKQDSSCSCTIIVTRKEEKLVTNLLITSLTILSDTSRLEQIAESKKLEAQRFSTYLTLVLIIVLLLVTIYTSLITARSITSPLTALIKGTEIIGKGNLGYRVEINADDEISELALAFNQMTGNLRETTTSINKLTKEISERIKVEESLKRSEAAFRAIFEQAAVGVVLADWDTGNFLRVNQKYLDIVGYTEEELFKLTFKEITHPDDLQKDIRNVELLKEGSIQYFSLIKRYIRKDASFIWVNITVSPLLDPIKDSKRFIGIVEDITMRKKAEDEVLAKRESLQVINKTLRHDITNDFSVITSALNIFKRNHNISMLNEIEKRVTKSLDTISRLREKEVFIDNHLPLKQYELRTIINSIQINYSDVTINITGSGKVLADEALYSVLENIINNAIKHGKANTIGISISTKNQFCVITINDNGKGIPDSIKGHVFEEGFFHGDTGHTGIGLYIVKKTIESYGGTIEVKDNQPVGTSFIITLSKAL